MNEAVQTLDGWYALHDFRTLNWKAWKAEDGETRGQIVQEFMELTGSFTDAAAARKGSYGQYVIAGHKADLLFLHMRPTIAELIEIETAFNRTRLAEYMTRPYSYLSVVELSSYLAKGVEDPDTDPYLQKRLKPVLPEPKHICFYPMNKKREGDDNWFMTPMEERRDMMISHGKIGRAYADKVRQIITGSIGLDDWEWGVTLYADDPLQFKKLIYEMRFDEASARFAEFGPFLVGHSVTDGELQEWLDV